MAERKRFKVLADVLLAGTLVLTCFSNSSAMFASKPKESGAVRGGFFSKDEKKEILSAVSAFDASMFVTSSKYICDEQAYLYCYIREKDSLDSKYGADGKVAIPKTVYEKLFGKYLKGFVVVDTEKYLKECDKHDFGTVRIDDNCKIEGINKATGEWYEVISYEDDKVVIDLNYEDMLTYTYNIRGLAKKGNKITADMEQRLKGEITLNGNAIGAIGDVSKVCRYKLKGKSGGYFVVGKTLLEDNFPVKK